MDFALNQKTAPNLGFAAFLDLAADLGCVGIEPRNDLGRPLFDGIEPARAGEMARERGLRLIGLSEIYGCPHTTMFGTLSARTAYSIAAASDRSPIEMPSAVAGGMRLPTLRMVKRSPGSVEASKSGTTRLSEQVTNRASGA